MNIKSIQKLTTIDYPGHLSCILFFFGCNFKCGFCHNPELVLKNLNSNISIEEVMNFLKKRKKYLSGVCLTGGEPLLDLDIEFLQKIKELGYFIKLDTNGSNPDKLKKFIDLNLIDYVAMDIKASPKNYSKITDSKIDLNNIEKTIKIVSNLEDYEFRTTIIKKIHDTKEVEKIAIWLNNLIGKPKKFFLQGFKNKGKFIDNKFLQEEDVEEDYLKKLKEVIEPYFKEIGLRV